ncbi:MAG: hypothetical protein ACRCZP_15705 [Phycicoccus sp.]
MSTTRKRSTAARRRASSAGRQMLGRVRSNAGRGWKRTLRKHPALGVLLSIVLAAVGVLLLITGLIAQNALYYLAFALSALGSVAVARAGHLERQRQERQRAGRPTVHTPPRRERPAEPRTEQPPAAGGVVQCTDTGRPIADCDCASRHVATADGAKRYGLSVGAPMGRRKKTGRESATRKAS